VPERPAGERHSRTSPTDPWHRRMENAFNRLCDNGPAPVWLHMLRGLALSGGPYPFASVDSTDIARNHCRHGRNARAMADRWDSRQSPARWAITEQLQLDRGRDFRRMDAAGAPVGASRRIELEPGRQHCLPLASTDVDFRVLNVEGCGESEAVRRTGLAGRAACA
jgi:hypothetical protein